MTYLAFYQYTFAVKIIMISSNKILFVAVWLSPNWFRQISFFYFGSVKSLLCICRWIKCNYTLRIKKKQILLYIYKIYLALFSYLLFCRLYVRVGYSVNVLCRSTVLAIICENWHLTYMWKALACPHHFTKREGFRDGSRISS